MTHMLVLFFHVLLLIDLIAGRNKKKKRNIKQFKHLDIQVANDQTFEWDWAITHLKGGERDT